MISSLWSGKALLLVNILTCHAAATSPVVHGWPAPQHLYFFIFLFIV